MTIPPHIAAELARIGVVVPKAPVDRTQVAWKPEFKGQEPPF
jgi:hypothetical protein